MELRKTPVVIPRGLKNLSPQDGVGLLGRAMVGPAPGGSTGSTLAPTRKSDRAQGA